MILLKRLELNAIRVNNRNWIRSYLSNTKRCIEIDSTTKTSLEQVIPHGSILAPLLFLFMSMTSKILQLPLIFEISGNIFIAIIVIPVCDVKNFEIYLSFLIKLFSYITKKVME